MNPVAAKGTNPAPATAAANNPAAAAPVPTADSKNLAAVREPSTLLAWDEVQAVQISEPLTIPDDAFVLFDGETPPQVKWAPPVAALLGLFILLNLYYLARLRSRPEE